MNMNQLEIAVTRAAIFEIVVSVIVLIALFWGTYWVIKAGVRDGIIEAEKRTRWRDAVRRSEPITNSDRLPDMRAD